PNVVLLDVGLPDLDGAEVYRRLRAYPQTSAAHVLFLTAATSLDLHQRAEDAASRQEQDDVPPTSQPIVYNEGECLIETPRPRWGRSSEDRSSGCPRKWSP